MFGRVFDFQFARELGERIARGVRNQNGREFERVERGIRQTHSAALEKLHVEPNGVTDDRIFADETSERRNERIERRRAFNIRARDTGETFYLCRERASGIDEA